MDEDEIASRSLTKLYAESKGRENIADKLWGDIPGNLKEAYNSALNIRKKLRPISDDLEALKKGLKDQLRALGILTSKVAENVDVLERGVIETGQQPVCLAGTSLIFNKMACSVKLSGLEGKEPFIPLFYVADYDGIQNELLNVRIPSPSPKGLLISLPSESERFGSPIYTLNNPPEKWLKDSLEKILNNYKGLMKEAAENLRLSKIQNLEHAFTIIKGSFHSSGNVSEWSTKIVGSLINIEADLGIPILSFSAASTRTIFQSGYELLLTEPNRSRFIEAVNGAVQIILDSGFNPQIGIRSENYVPFFLECMNEKCHRQRIELKYRSDQRSTTAHVLGKCPTCGQEYDFSFEADKPDLSEIIEWISPRVDSRQIIVGSLLPVVSHLGGPGEASYYAEVIPAAMRLKLPFPAFFRYTRVFYNTPWNEDLAKALKAKECPTLMNRGLFAALSRWVNARNMGDATELSGAHEAFQRNIEETFTSLLEKGQRLSNDIDEIKKALGKVTDRSSLLEEMRKKQNVYNEISLYLSSQFGRFSPEKFGQEVNWSWLDLAAASGVNDLMGVFQRLYNEHTPNSSMFYANI